MTAIRLGLISASLTPSARLMIQLLCRLTSLFDIVTSGRPEASSSERLLLMVMCAALSVNQWRPCSSLMTKSSLFTLPNPNSCIIRVSGCGMQNWGETTATCVAEHSRRGGSVSSVDAASAATACFSGTFQHAHPLGAANEGRLARRPWRACRTCSTNCLLLPAACRAGRARSPATCC